MPTEQHLHCNHCGGTAISSRRGFCDGDGGRCASCGFPGSVHIDDAGERPEAWWSESQEPGDRCCDPGCVECSPERLAEFSADGYVEDAILMTPDILEGFFDGYIDRIETESMSAIPDQPARVVVQVFRREA